MLCWALVLRGTGTGRELKACSMITFYCLSPRLRTFARPVPLTRLRAITRSAHEDRSSYKCLRLDSGSTLSDTF